MGYLPVDPSDIKLRVLLSYTFVPMSEVEQDVQQMVAARAQALLDPVCNLPAAKRQATILPQVTDAQKIFSVPRFCLACVQGGSYFWPVRWKAPGGSYFWGGS